MLNFSHTIFFKNSKFATTALSIVAILLVASCGGKMKKDKETNGEITEAIIEDKSNDQNNYQSLADEQQAESIDQQTEQEIKKIEEIEEIEVQDRVLFGYDSFDLSDEAKKILDTQAAWLKSDTSINITIEGHCDERGTREYNIALGEKRALSAKNYLTKASIAESRIKIISYGKERPAFFGNNEEAMSKNRRAVVIIN